MNLDKSLRSGPVRWAPSPLDETTDAPLQGIDPFLNRVDNSRMPIIGHGIDLVEVARIARMHADHGAHFLDRCFTPAEQQYCLGHKIFAERLAGRFALKEAILKVLGTGWRGQILWTDMEILNNSFGKPELVLSGETARLAAQQGITRWHVSITHTQNHAMASAIGESD